MYKLYTYLSYSILCLLITFSLSAQTVDLKSFNLFGQSGYMIEGKLGVDGMYEFSMYKLGAGNKKEGEVSFSLRPLFKEAFIQNFFSSYEKFLANVTDKPSTMPAAKKLAYPAASQETADSESYRKMEAEASKLFYMFVSGSLIVQNLDDKPVAGEICFEDNIKILRRDYNEESLKKRLKSSWKNYKRQQQQVNQLLKSDSIDLIEKVLQGINDTSNVISQTLFRDSLFSDLDMAELLKPLNKRKFYKKRNKELLMATANQRQEIYQRQVDELSQLRESLLKLGNEIREYTLTIAILDTLKTVEEDFTNISEEVDADYNLTGSESVRMDLMEHNRYMYDIIISSGITTNATRDFKSVSMLIDEYLDCVARSSCFGTEDCTDLGKRMVEDMNLEINRLNNELTNLKSKRRALDRSENISEAEGDNAPSALSDTMNLQQEEALFSQLIEFYKKAVRVRDTIVNRDKEYCKLVEQKGKYESDLERLIDAIPIERYKYNLDNAYAGVFENKTSLKDEIEDRSSLIKEYLEIDKKEKADLENKKRAMIRKLALLEDLLVFKAFKVDSIVVEINEGFIENILMVGTVEEYADKFGNTSFAKGDTLEVTTRTLKFENSSPIGFSRKLDFDAMKGKKLYTKGGEKTHYETYLEDVLDVYIQTHRVGRRDYSPANQIVTLSNPSGKLDYCKKLYKDATFRLFEAKIFSDFVGLDATEPNGLIQTEINKRINILTNRRPFQFLGSEGLRNVWNIGWLAYFEPSVKLSKIEDNNRYLVLDSRDRFVNNQYLPIKYASTLSIKQFENFSAGVDANIFLLDFPNLKSSLYVNYGFRYGRTAVRDSIRTYTNGNVQINPAGALEYGVNTFSHYPKIALNIFEDERYGIALSWQYQWFYLKDNRFEQVANSTFFGDRQVNLEKKAPKFTTFQILTYIEPTSENKGRLFFRYTYNWQQGFWRTGFHQAQVGYSFYLLGRQAK